MRPSVIHYAGPCDLKGCNELGAHGHPTCPACGALRYSNDIYCVACRDRQLLYRSLGTRAILSKPEGGR